MQKHYTFVTTYIVKALDETKARETVDNVRSQLRPDTQTVEHWTTLTDIEDVEDD